MTGDTTPTRRIERTCVPTIVGLLSMLLVPLGLASELDNASVSAVGLLTAFSGESASRYESLFQFSDKRKIVSVEIHAVGNHETTAQYSGQENAWHEVNNILRITSADGFEGVSGVDAYYDGKFGDELLLELQGVAGDLLALRSLDPVKVGTVLAQTRPDLSDASRSSIDIALWDMAARRAGLPLYRLLGAKRDSIKPYASLPFYQSLPEYIEAVYDDAALGYTSFKFHVWGQIEKDLQLVARVQQSFADSSYKFMFDLETAYNFEDALRLGKAMDEGLFIWLEAPVNDTLLGQYAKLRNQLGVALIPAGYINYSKEFISQGIKTGAWDAGRFDATVVGGITKALQLLMITNKADLPVEIQSWGYSLAQAANLHLMLANEHTQYFEAPMPKHAFEFGMKNGNLLDRGRALAPAGPGLGIVVDWDLLAEADFYLKSLNGHLANR